MKIAQREDADLIAKLDAFTKQGQRQAVLSTIQKISKQNPSSSLKSELAQLANRNHAYLLALRLLHADIRNDREQIAKATSTQLTTYAKSLLSIGALEEASDCLGRIKGTSPDVLLTEAFILFAKWDYQKALPVLIKYIQQPSLTEYQRSVGKINLLAATIVSGDLKTAWLLSEELLSILESNPHYRLLLGNCLELRAQIHLCSNSFEEALLVLDEAENALSQQAGRYALYINKWRAIARLGLKSADKNAQEMLLAVRRQAQDLKIWETVRDCDFHFARLCNDNKLLQRVLLGTPYKGFHQRNQRLFNIEVSEDKCLKYCPSELLTTPKTIGLDLEAITSDSFLSSTSWPLLQVLTFDVYRPPRASVVFSALYKDQYFDPFTSVQRVRNAVFRFNEWAKEEKMSLSIEINKSEFHLIVPPAIGISLKRRNRLQEDWQVRFKAFRIHNEGRSFRCKDVAEFLNVTAPTALKLVKQGLAKGKLRKVDHSKNSRYVFIPVKKLE